MKFKPTILFTSALILTPCFTVLSEAKALNLKVTEIMYDQYSEYNGDYPWIEFKNVGDEDIDLSNYLYSVFSLIGRSESPRCFNPFDSNCVSEEDLEIMKKSNIPLKSPTVSPGEIFVIYGSVTRDPKNDWGSGGLKPLSQIWNPDSSRDINFIPAFEPGCQGVQHIPWCGIGLHYYNRVPKVQFGFWELEDWDAAQNRDFSKAVFEFTFENPTKLIGSTFPQSNNSASIYLTDLSANPNDGSNWALSIAGLDGAYAVEANTLRGRIEPGLDVGSPGYVPTSANVPEPLTILGSITALGFGGLFKRKFSKKNL